jgi:hypothetical protein
MRVFGGGSHATTFLAFVFLHPRTLDVLGQRFTPGKCWLPFSYHWIIPIAGISYLVVIGQCLGSFLKLLLVAKSNTLPRRHSIIHAQCI